MAEFDYKQRPFSKQLTDEQYDIAVGRIKPITRKKQYVRPARTIGEFLAHPDKCPCSTCKAFRKDYPVRRAR